MSLRLERVFQLGINKVFLQIAIVVSPRNYFLKYVRVISRKVSQLELFPNESAPTTMYIAETEPEHDMKTVQTEKTSYNVLASRFLKRSGIFCGNVETANCFEQRPNPSDQSLCDLWQLHLFPSYIYGFIYLKQIHMNIYIYISLRMKLSKIEIWVMQLNCLFLLLFIRTLT